MEEEGQGGGSGGGNSTLLGSGQGQGQGQGQQAPSPIGHNDWLVEGKFGTGLSSRLPDDLKPYEGSIKKFEGTPIQDVLKSYGELEKKLGQRVQPPGEGAKPEEIAAWRKTVGAPEKPDDYKIEKPENVPDELWNADLVKGFQEVAHGLHLSPAQAGKLAEWWNGQQMGALQKHQQDTEANRNALSETLKSEWGEKYSTNLQGAQRVATLAKLDVNDPEIGDNPAVIKALHSLSTLIAEDRQVTGGSDWPRLTQNQKADDIMANKANPLYADYHGQNGPERQAAAANEMRRLRALAGAAA
jgi:hypothetical protein